MAFGISASALFVGGTTLAGSLLSSNASNNAADAQAGAAAASDATQRYFYDTNRTDNKPAIEARDYGLAGYKNLLANPSSLTSDPGYQFGLSQGRNALEASAAARGGLYSGSTLKALQRYGQDYGSTKFDAALGRFSTLAGLGQPGAAAISSAGLNAANQMSNNALYGGDSAAYNALSHGNGWTNALNQFGAYGQRNGWFTDKPTGPSNAELESQYGFSDMRLKTKLTRIGTSPGGHAVYSFEWLDGTPGVGVIAQEVQASDPSIVRERDGFLQVNYARI